MTFKLSPRTVELFDYICKFKQVNGYSPTVREMCIGINTKSRSHVQEMLDNLEQYGYLKIIHRKSTTNVIKVKKFISETDREKWTK